MENKLQFKKLVLREDTPAKVFYEMQQLYPYTEIMLESQDLQFTEEEKELILDGLEAMLELMGLKKGMIDKIWNLKTKIDGKVREG